MARACTNISARSPTRPDGARRSSRSGACRKRRDRRASTRRTSRRSSGFRSTPRWRGCRSRSSAHFWLKSERARSNRCGLAEVERTPRKLARRIAKKRHVSNGAGPDAPAAVVLAPPKQNLLRRFFGKRATAETANALRTSRQNSAAPLTRMIWPDSQRASGPHRKTTTSAMSSGLAIRPNGERCAAAARPASVLSPM